MIASSKVKAGLSRVSLFVLIGAAAALPFMPARAQDQKAEDQQNATAPEKQSVTPTAPGTPKGPIAAPAGQKADADILLFDGEEEFTTSWMGPRNKNPKFRLPDYIPAAHGNVVEIIPKHYFMLTPLESTHKWHVRYIPANMDEILTIPPLKDLKQGQTFPLQKNADTEIVAFVEAEYANDRDIGVRIIDNATGEVKHQCTLLMNVSRYQWVADGISEK